MGVLSDSSAGQCFISDVQLWVIQEANHIRFVTGCHLINVHEMHSTRGGTDSSVGGPNFGQLLIYSNRGVLVRWYENHQCSSFVRRVKLLRM